jgi:hypothetical protein
MHEEQVRQRAQELREGGDEGAKPEDSEAAETMAARLLEESEERTLASAPRDPEDEEVIRRSSEETA